MTRRFQSALVSLLIAGFFSAGTVAADEQEAMRDWLRTGLAAACPAGLDDPQGLAAALDGAEIVDIEDRGNASGPNRRRVTLQDSAKGQLTITATRRGETLQSLSLEALKEARPIMMLRSGGDCAVIMARAIAYDVLGLAVELVHLDAELLPTETREPLNPPVPPGADPGGVAVAQVDSGVNYLLPAIVARLARDETGEILGYDYWELDRRPFDGNPSRSAFFPIRHGTTTASVLLREAPDVRLLPYRYPRPEMARMAKLIEEAAAAGAGIVAMALGSRDRAEWTAFQRAAEAHPEMLFIVSAGNDGLNIDEAPLYPAILTLENLLVVTSSDAFGRLAPGSNWGPRSVDLMVPAEGIEVIDHRGALGKASGSSYAVPRVAALAARLKARDPSWTAPALKRAILKRAVPPRSRGASPVRYGWIPNPADDG